MDHPRSAADAPYSRLRPLSRRAALRDHPRQLPPLPGWSALAQPRRQVSLVLRGGRHQSRKPGGSGLKCASEAASEIFNKNNRGTRLSPLSPQEVGTQKDTAHGQGGRNAEAKQRSWCSVLCVAVAVAIADAAVTVTVAVPRYSKHRRCTNAKPNS